MIFLSHTHSDKPVVEPIALRLLEIFGEERVFYDSWSIQPGDGIIDMMNAGLENPRFVFFFVSEASLKSKMVELEWQNALMKATKGECKIIPVKLDGSKMPAVLTQTLYIDMFHNGMDVAVQQIIGVIQGTKGFEPAHESFSNLTWSVEGEPTKELVITVRASHLMEPNPFFAVCLKNNSDQVLVGLSDFEMHTGGYNPDLEVNGEIVNVWTVAPVGGAIVPKRPLRISVKSKDGSVISLRAVLHRLEGKMYGNIPRSNAF